MANQIEHQSGKALGLVLPSKGYPPGLASPKSKRSRRLSRNSRPPTNAEEGTPPVPTLHHNTSEPSPSRQASTHFPTSGPDDSSAASPSPCRSARHSIPQSLSQANHCSSPSSAFLQLPLFVEHDRPLTNPSWTPDQRKAPGHLLRCHSQKDSERRRTRNSPRLQQDFDLSLPSESQQYSWSTNARRWSSSLPRTRDSAAFALRLAENASPYLRAGLEELRSIFDVDSNPFPDSPFQDDDEEDLSDTVSRSRSSDEEITAVVSLHASPLSVHEELIGPHHAEPAEQSSLAPSLGPRYSSTTWRRSPQCKEKSLPEVAHYADGWSRTSPSQNTQLGFLAWSLTAVAVGITGLCAWGYAMQSDTFSPTLIGFFLTQPAFAFLGLGALFLRRRALMDLSSRAMRAHVLAQALIVMLAYLDLSASSIYSSSSPTQDPNTASHRFPMVPTMEMRFGPVRRAREAGQGVNLAFGSAMRTSTNQDGSDSSTLGNAASLASTSILQTVSGCARSSMTAHDTHVGDWRSRFTHLIVFIAQAAIPIAVVFIGQYVVAQRLAQYARRGCLSRQNSGRSAHGKCNHDVKVLDLAVPFPGIDRNGNQSAPRLTLEIPAQQCTATERAMPPALSKMQRYVKRREGRQRPTTTAGTFSEHDAQSNEGKPAPLSQGQHRHKRSTSHPVDLASSVLQI